MSESSTVTVSILDRDYLVACPPDGRDALHAAARLLDGRLRELRRNARSATLERLAIMVALNLAHEQQQARSEADGVAGGVDRDLRQLLARLDAALAEG